jgi:hypothetical protein
MPYLIPGLPKLNPGLELANTFGVMVRALASVSHHTVAALPRYESYG